MRTRLLTCAMCALLLAGAANARESVTDPSIPRSLPTAGNVSVQWTDPAQFTEFRTSLNKQESADGDWVRQLATYLQKRAQNRLQPGQSLDVTITDIQRAGNYEPWHGIGARDIRVMRDIYIPRIAFDYTLRDAGGNVIEEGSAKLRDAAYLQRATIVGDSDPLRYEKSMIDDWLRRELHGASSGTG